MMVALGTGEYDMAAYDPNKVTTWVYAYFAGQRWVDSASFGGYCGLRHALWLTRWVPLLLASAPDVCACACVQAIKLVWSCHREVISDTLIPANFEIPDAS
eukprot:3356099-Pyramimonas_sp.AAC.3